MQQKIFNLRVNIYLTISVALVLLIFLHAIGILKPLENTLFFILRPVEDAAFHLGINVLDSENYQIKEGLEQENAELKNKLNNTIIENARLHSLISQSETTQQELQFLEENKFNAETARIIGKVSDSSAQIYLLDKGKKSGIQTDFSVIYLNGIIVGKIVSANDYSSKMLLINDSSSAIGALVQNESNSPGIVVGKLGLSLEMQFIPQAEEIAKSQIVVTSGSEQNIPAGLVIGKITDIHKKTEELFQTATIESPVTLDRLDVVSIIIP